MGMRYEARRWPRSLRTKSGMQLLPVALRECNFVITLKTSSLEIDIKDGIFGAHVAVMMSERLA
jgi:hypothetical protein